MQILITHHRTISPNPQGAYTRDILSSNNKTELMTYTILEKYGSDSSSEDMSDSDQQLDEQNEVSASSVSEEEEAEDSTKPGMSKPNRRT
jgi:hypothetical protein